MSLPIAAQALPTSAPYLHQPLTYHMQPSSCTTHAYSSTIAYIGSLTTTHRYIATTYAYMYPWCRAILVYVPYPHVGILCNNHATLHAPMPPLSALQYPCQAYGLLPSGPSTDPRLPFTIGPLAANYRPASTSVASISVAIWSARTRRLTEATGQNSRAAEVASAIMFEGKRASRGRTANSMACDLLLLMLLE